MSSSINGCTKRSSHGKQAIEKGAGPCGVCRNCKIEDSRIASRADRRRFAYQTRFRRELMNLALITVFKIRDQGSKELNLRAVEEILKSPESLDGVIGTKRYYSMLIKRYRDFIGDDADLQEKEGDDADFQEKEGDSDANIQKEKDDK